MSVKHIQEIEASVFDNGAGTAKKVLISLDEAPNFAMRCFSIQPGGTLPNHTNLVEQYVLGGHARAGIGGETFEVKKGYCLYSARDFLLVNKYWGRAF